MVLTPRQCEVSRVIRNYAALNHRAPTYDEIGEQLSIGKVCVREHLLELSRKGVVEYVPAESRTLRLLVDRLPDEDRPTRLPVLADFTEGRPLALSVADPVDLEQLFPAGCYALRVKGDGFKQFGICDRDVIVVSGEIRSAKSGEFVIWLNRPGGVEGGVCMKKYQGKFGLAGVGVVVGMLRIA